MQRHHLRVSKHVISRIHERIGVAVSEGEIIGGASAGAKLFLTSDGTTYFLCYIRGKQVVLALRKRDVVTAVTVRMAFQDCPAAVFYVLISTGQLASALSLRAKYPRPIGRMQDAKYAQYKCHVLWNAFKFAENAQQ